MQKAFPCSFFEKRKEEREAKVQAAIEAWKNELT